MARNEEKSTNMFNRWKVLKQEQHGDLGVATRRPNVASMCKSLGEAEKWRRELVNEATKNIALIQNAALGEGKIRELNDEINRTTRTLHHWNLRVRELGGPDHRSQKHALDVEGKVLPGAGGGGGAYKYYGAAKDLPGVREKFAEHAALSGSSGSGKASGGSSIVKRSIGELYRRITPEYYGFGEEEDARLLAKEKARERELQQTAVAIHREQVRAAESEVARTGGVFGASALAALGHPTGAHNGGGGGDDDDDDDEIDAAVVDAYEASVAQGAADVSSYIALPSEDTIARLVMEEKKKKMLAALM
jgi:pre-mRNA-splicing factor ISY1